MTTKLELQFLNSDNKTITLSIDSPIEPVDPIAVNNVMDTIITNNIFTSIGGDLIAKKGSRIVSRTVTDVNLGL